ncbi:MAG: hypothetical protein ACK56I_35755, partial [bacterium]
GAIGAEHAAQRAARDLEVETGDGESVTEALLGAANGDGGRHRAVQFREQDMGRGCWRARGVFPRGATLELARARCEGAGVTDVSKPAPCLARPRRQRVPRGGVVRPCPRRLAAAQGPR